MVNWVYYEMGNLQEKHTVKVHCLSHPQSPQLSFTHNAFCSVYYKVFLSHFKFNFTGGTLFIQLFMVLQSGIQRASQKPISCFLGGFFFKHPINPPLSWTRLLLWKFQEISSFRDTRVFIQGEDLNRNLSMFLFRALLRWAGTKIFKPHLDPIFR